ncbi:MAG: polynucleotide adenylyltransferase PcnB [Gammaproteobacteria bacterium]|nr:polynucleotide adenylyltransferase PcnB [Gammaproteobacteria bacterium]
MPSGPQVVARDQHCISRKDISDNALKVLYRLKNAGYEAYLVGGGVRDLLLGGHPKDFDIATNAHPEEVKELFRNSRLIGRRFRLVHVLYGREMIEVATFRAAPQDASHAQHQQSETGQLLKDNVYGNLNEDALRRDFTINALYYSIDDFSVRDFANGLNDLKARQIQLIGDPESRYREDPVRMLRALRFAAKLRFEIAPETAAPIYKLGDLLDHIPSARLFDESQKIFTSGHAQACWQLLNSYGLTAHLFPLITAQASKGSSNYSEHLIHQAMCNTDERIQEGKHIAPSFLFAVLLWHPVNDKMKALQNEGLPQVPALHKAAQAVLEQQTRIISIPRRFTTAMREMWELQFKLGRRHGTRAERLISHPRFRAAYDFLLLREQSGEIPPGLGQWWTQYQAADEEARKKLVAELSPNQPGAKKRRRPRKKPAKPQD